MFDSLPIPNKVGKNIVVANTFNANISFLGPVVPIIRGVYKFVRTMCVRGWMDVDVSLETRISRPILKQVGIDFLYLKIIEIF